MTDAVVLRDLLEFGPPIYVPPSPGWRVAAVEHTNGEPSGVLVFAAAGEWEVQTYSSASPRQPLSIQVANVQAATVNGAPPNEWHRVVADDEDAQVMVDG